MKQEQDKGANKRDRRLLGVAGGVFVLAACVFGGLYSQRNAAQSPSTPPALPQPQARVIADISADEKVQFVEHAKMLREKWRPWAEKHQAELNRMLNAGPTDFAAMTAVWDAVPAAPEAVGITAQELMPTDNPLRGVGFGWAALDKGLTGGVPRPQVAEMLQKAAAMMGPRQRREFKAQRDVVIAAGGLKTETLLWASGRITQHSKLSADEYVQMARKAADEHRRVKEEDAWGPTEEAERPYEFLSPQTR